MKSSDPGALNARDEKSRYQLPTAPQECLLAEYLIIQCDETKPICNRCKQRPDKCKYEFKLCWTEGRPFKNKNRQKEKARQQPSSTQATASSNVQVWQSEPTIRPAQPALAESSAIGLNVGHALGSPRRPDDSVENEIDRRASLAVSESTCSDYSVATPRTPRFGRLDKFGVYQQDPVGMTWHHWQQAKPYCQQKPSPVHYYDWQIPQTISTTASPIISSSETRFFLHHYINNTAGVIFPLSLKANPLSEALLQSAMNSSHLLYAFLACASSHYISLRGDPTGEMTKSVTKFTNAALNGLRLAMIDPNQAGKLSTLTTALALCTSDVISGGLNTWRIHLSGASNLIASVFELQSNDDSVSTQDPTKLFLIKWFALLDIFAGVGGLRKSSNAGSYWSLPTSNDTGGYIDEWTGYSLELIPIMAEIGKMARIQRKRSKVISLDDDGSEDEAASEQSRMETVEDIQRVESQIYALYDRTTHPDLDSNPATKTTAQEMRHIHRIFLHTNLLHLYRRVQGLPKEHPKPAHAIHMVIELLLKIRSTSMANILCLWPVFTVGCETEDEFQRQIIKDRLANMEAFGMGNVQSARKAMAEYWECGAKERWDIWLEDRGFDLSLF
ncbi:uncharacterized protein N7482_007240 [Penicillium canariense]|uniref:Zn(2)-C6 fungal-type domain-containing protein n=1 Tax=Penicillium canariense TaxID=189055 RepID=A0A9W9HZ31_9EURO|nr:uncharacterized protein N7482_007240 [Penicillium canariense]KAJ5160236.1 hypothetical protein N7482_007240 [Penicillium canariense]